MKRLVEAARQRELGMKVSGNLSLTPGTPVSSRESGSSRPSFELE